MAGSRKIQPVSFSLSDPFETKLYKHAVKNGAFSKYIKRLIQRDMERGLRLAEETKKAPRLPVSNQSLVLVNGQLVPRQ